jgi:uncharacterized membrane protein
MRARFAEAVSVATVAVAWVWAAASIAALPAMVATHFDGRGAPTAYGAKATLWALPIVTTVMYFFLSATQLIPPRLMNLPVRVTDANRGAVYAIAREMLSAVKACTVLTFFTLECAMLYSVAHSVQAGWYNAVIFIPVAVMLAFVLDATLRMRRAAALLQREAFD